MFVCFVLFKQQHHGEGGLIQRETEADKKPRWSIWDLISPWRVSTTVMCQSTAFSPSFTSPWTTCLTQTPLWLLSCSHLLLVIQKAERPGWDDSRYFFAHHSNRSRLQESLISSRTVTGLTCSKNDLCSVSWRKKSNILQCSWPQQSVSTLLIHEIALLC